MQELNSTALVKLIKAHMDNDNERFYLYADCIANICEDNGDTDGAKQIRKELNIKKSDTKFNNLQKVDNYLNKKKKEKVQYAKSIISKLESWFPDIVLEQSYRINTAYIGVAFNCISGGKPCIFKACELFTDEVDKLYSDCGGSMSSVEDISDDKSLKEYIQNWSDFVKEGSDKK